MYTWFGVCFKRQTYLNLIYLLLAFPLSLGYSGFLAAGLSVGLGLAWSGIQLLDLPESIDVLSAIKLVSVAGGLVLGGVLTLLTMAAVGWIPIVLERKLVVWLLGEEMPAVVRRERVAGKGVWGWIRAHACSPVTWTGLLYLALKIPFGTAAFTAVITLLALAGAMLVAPITYLAGYHDLILVCWRIDSFGKALVASALAWVVGPAALHALNLLAFGSGRLARVLLGGWRRRQET